MATNAFDIAAKLTLDSSSFDSGLEKAKGLASGLATGLKMAGAAVATATTAIVGFGAASVKTGAEFDKSMSQVAATMGLSMDELEKQVGSVDTAWGKFNGNLRDYAQFLGSNTAFSAKEASDALNYMALAGYDATTSMQMLPNVLNLAAAGDMELARASDMVTDTQTAFGISLERTSQMVDEMAKAASTGNTSVEQLGDAFLVVGGLAQELNGGMVTLKDGTTASVDGVQELEIALTGMANAGIKGSEAGTHMRNMIMKLSSPTSDGTKALEAMGVAVFDTEGQMRSLADVFGDLSDKLGEMSQEQKIQTISDLFNARDLTSAKALLNAVNQDWDKIGESILGAEGAAQKMADTQLDNLAGDVTLFKSALEGAQIVVSDGLAPQFRDFVQFGTKGLSQLTDSFKQGGLTSVIDSFGSLLAQGLSMISDKIPVAVNAGLQLLEAFGKGIVDNASTLLASLAEVGSQLTKKALEIMQTVADGLSTFDWTTAVQNVVDFIVDALTGNTATQFLTAGFSIIQSLISGMMQSLPAITNGAVDLIHALTQGIQQNFPKLIESGMNSLMEFSGSLRENAGKLVDAGLELIVSLVRGLIKGLPTLIKTIPTIVSNIAGIINDNAPKILMTGVQLLGELAIGIVQAIPTLIAEFPKIIKMIIDVWTAINWLNLGVKLITGIMNGIKNLSSQVPNALKDIGQRAVELFKGINWKGLGTNIINFIKNGITGLATAIPNALKAIGESAIELVKNIDWLSLGKNIVEGIASGITKFASSIWNAITSAVKGGKDAAEKEAQINSPSKLYRDSIGKFLGLGVAEGIKDTQTDVENAMADLVGITDNDVNTDFSTNNVGYRSNAFEGNAIINYSDLAKAIVDAFVEADINVDVDGREFGRLVKKAVAY